MRLNLTTGERLSRVAALVRYYQQRAHRRAYPYVIKISGAPDGSLLWSAPGAIGPSRFRSRDRAEKVAARLRGMYPTLRVRVMRRVTGAPLSATLRRHGMVM